MATVNLPRTAALLLVASLATLRAQSPAQATAFARLQADVVAAHAAHCHALYLAVEQKAKLLAQAIDALLTAPDETTLAAARRAWCEARVVYGKTEVLRFHDGPIEPIEPFLNAWPIDEAYNDAVVGHPTAGIVNDPVRYPSLGAAVLAIANERGGEANVSTGWHAIEFLLWGQDLNGTGPGAGNRPWTDYARGATCTHGNCDRRGQYLTAATELLVDDLGWMARQWAKGGKARQALAKRGPDGGISAILTGIGSLSYGELAGERMKLGLMLHDPEEEHDCFSDNTHNSHYYDVVGMRAVWSGTYRRTDGSTVTGPSPADLTKATDPALAAEMQAKLDATEAAMRRVKERAETREAYDQMIGADNPEGNAVVQAAIDRLTDQTKTLERVVAALKLKPIQFEGSKSLDDPGKVFQKK